MKIPEYLEKKDSVFYVRCKERIRKILHTAKDEDGYYSMADWFEQFILTVLVKKKIYSGKKKTSKRHKKIRSAISKRVAKNSKGVRGK